MLCLLATVATVAPRSPPRAVPPPPLVTVREAELGFVSAENLEDSERLVRALKAHDDAGRLLCAGALLKRHSASRNCDVHECWIADSIEAGVGPNIQQRGGSAVLDRLFLEHLSDATIDERTDVRASDLRRTPNPHRMPQMPSPSHTPLPWPSRLITHAPWLATAAP